MISALCALVFAQALSPVQDSGVFPKVEDIQPSPEYLNWSGFGFLKPGPRKVPEGSWSFRAPGDWTPVEAAAAQTLDPNAIPWHAKFFIWKRVDRVDKLADGTLFEEQCSLETPDLDRIRRSIQQFAALVGFESRGKVRLVPDVSIESDPVLLGNKSLDEKVAEYVYPRINGGSYQADDRLYRGPFQSVFCIHAVPSIERPQMQIVNGSPVISLSGARGIGYQTDGALATDLASLWFLQVRKLAQDTGLQGPMTGVSLADPAIGESSPLPWVPSQDWASILLGADLDASAIDSRLRLPVDPELRIRPLLDKENQPSEPTPPRSLYRSCYKDAGTEVRFESDPAHGSILTYSERGTARNGGLVFPVPADDTPSIPGSLPTLSFWARSASKDPLEFKIDGSNKLAEVCLGRDLPGPVQNYQVDFERDGQWHQVKIDLTRLGIPAVKSIKIEPTWNAQCHPKITFGPVEYSFADFKADSEAAGGEVAPIVPDPDSPDAWARAVWAHQQTSASPKLAALLKDPQWFVRLNALQVYIAKPDPSAEAMLTEDATLTIDGPVTAAALDALWALGTDSAKAVVAQATQTGVTEQAKAEAADLITRSKDAGVAQKLIALNQSRTLETRIAAVKALGRLPGEGPAEIRMSFLLQSDPQLKLEVTRTLDADEPNQQRELKISAVDEPSDAVRAESDKALISSKDPSVRAEGYKGIKDDSLGVRLTLLQFFAEHPNEAHRNAIRIAVTDRSARVRALAIRAFAALPGAVSWDEVGAAAEDRHPIVELALAELSRRKNLKLSDQMSSQMKNSPDPGVRAAAKDLG